MASLRVTDEMRTFSHMAIEAPDRTVPASVEEYRRLKRRDRQVLGLGDFTPEDIAAIEAARVDPKYDHLNEELEDWRP